MVELTGDEIVNMLEENLEKQLASDPYDQMGGYIKRGLGLTVYLKIENPAGQRIQRNNASIPVEPQTLVCGTSRNIHPCLAWRQEIEFIHKAKPLEI